MRLAYDDVVIACQIQQKQQISTVCQIPANQDTTPTVKKNLQPGDGFVTQIKNQLSVYTDIYYLYQLKSVIQFY